MPPQGRSKSPQRLLGHAGGVQPQTFGVGGVPPSQVFGCVQTPQSIVPVPQPLSILLQFNGAGQVVIGVQPQTPGAFLPQVCDGAHGAQGAPPMPQAASVVAVMQVSPAQQPAQVVAHPGEV